jgi:hypothetical protein
MPWLMISAGNRWRRYGLVAGRVCMWQGARRSGSWNVEVHATKPGLDKPCRTGYGRTTRGGGTE